MSTANNKKYKICASGFLALIYIGQYLGITQYINCFTYQFYHANIFHLAANLYALWIMKFNKKSIIPSYAISVVSYLLFPHAIGFSGILMVIMGIYANKKTWKYFLLFSIITFFIPNMAFGVHTVCFVSGFIYGRIQCKINEYRAAYTGR